MKRKIVIALFLILLTGCTFSEKLTTTCTMQSHQHVHATIYPASKVVDNLDRGEQVVVTARVEVWYEITTPRLVDGYIPAESCK